MGQQFALAYSQYTGRWPEAFAFAAYDAMLLLADAVERAGSLQGPAIVIALENARIQLAAGSYSFPYTSLNPPGADGVPAYLWHQWPDVQTLYLQYTEPGQPTADMPVVWPERYRTVDAPIVR
jgi:ABC-type branched-subunit amino acid transport system substrate-binding protein